MLVGPIGSFSMFLEICERPVGRGSKKLLTADEYEEGYIHTLSLWSLFGGQEAGKDLNEVDVDFSDTPENGYCFS